MYVWLDALTNYLSALNYPNEKNELYKNGAKAVFNTYNDLSNSSNHFGSAQKLQRGRHFSDPTLFRVVLTS